MTIIEWHSIRLRKSLATAYSSLNPCEVRSPETTTTSGWSSFVSAIARSSRLGRKNCWPQCRSDSWTIVKGRSEPSIRRSLEDRAHRVIERGRDKPRRGQRQDPGDENVPGDAPAHRREAPGRPRPHDRPRDDVRRRDRKAVVRPEPEGRPGGNLRREAVLGLHLVD